MRDKIEHLIANPEALAAARIAYFGSIPHVTTELSRVVPRHEVAEEILLIAKILRDSGNAITVAAIAWVNHDLNSGDLEYVTQKILPSSIPHDAVPQDVSSLKHLDKARWSIGNLVVDSRIPVTDDFRNCLSGLHYLINPSEKVSGRDDFSDYSSILSTVPTFEEYLAVKAVQYWQELFVQRLTAQGFLRLTHIYDVSGIANRMDGIIRTIRDQSNSRPEISMPFIRKQYTEVNKCVGSRAKL